MQDIGFFHPDRGYWQVTGGISDEIRAAYPEGTVEVPLKPGAWYEWNGEVWVPGTMLPDQAEADVRGRRTLLLAESDWSMAPDAPTDKESWAAYRQALRDIPAQAGFPYAVVWPAKPGAR